MAGGVKGTVVGCGMIVGFVLHHIIDPSEPPGRGVGYYIFGAGVVLLVFGLAIAYMTGRATLTITKDSVSYQHRSVFGHAQWSEPLSSYDGVLLRTGAPERVPNENLDWVIRLKHWDVSRQIVLRREHSERKARQLQARCCRVLGLPALGAPNKAVVRREVADVQQGAGRLETPLETEKGFDPAVPPSSAVTLVELPRAVELTLRPGVLSWNSLVFLAIAGTLVAVGYIRGKTWLLGVGIVTCFLACAALYNSVWAVLTRRKLRLTGESVELIDRHPLGESVAKRIALDQIVSVVIAMQTDERPDAVVVLSAEEKIRFGEELNDEDLRWIKNRILCWLAEHKDQ